MDAQRRVYLRLYTTSLVNCFSDAVTALVLPLAFYARTGSVALAATLAAATTLPQLVLAIPLGALADRLPRRRVVIAGYLTEAVCLAVLALLIAVYPSWLAVVVVGCVRGTVSELGVAASAGYVTQVLGRESLLRYHSRVETIEGVAAIAGPPLAGAAVWLVGASWGLAVPAGLSALNAIIYSWLPVVSRPPSPEPAGGPSGRLAGVVRDAVAGLRYVASHPVLRAMVLVQLALGATTASYAFGVVTHLRADLALSNEVVGVVMAASGVGGILGSLVWERIVPVGRALHLLTGAFGVIAAVLAAFCLVPGPVSAALALLVLDACWVAVFIYAGTLEQYVSHDVMLARVESVSGSVFLLASVLTTAAASQVIPHAGPAAFMVLAAATCLPALASLVGLVVRGQQPRAVASGAAD